MTQALSAASVLFRDDFNEAVTNASRWHYNQWTPQNDRSFYGNTQQRQVLPESVDGVLRLKLDTFNPSGNPQQPTFFGSEAITHQKFSLGQGGIAFEMVARFDQTQPGIIGGLFTYGGGGDHHDEIDFEALSNNLNKIQTNIYQNEHHWEGAPISYPLASGTLTDYHTYRIEWMPNLVRWLVDGVVVREEVQKVPTMPMAMHLNIWGPPSSWETGHQSLQAVGSAAQNTSYYFNVDSAQVESLSSLRGTNQADLLVGTSQNDWIYGGNGQDQLMGGGGDNILDGGHGVDVARFTVSRADAEITQKLNGLVTVRTSSGTDTLQNIELLQFTDQIVLLRKPGAPGTLFDELGYLAQHADVAEAVQAGTIASGKDHFNAWGAQEGRSPNALFDESWYLAQNTDVAAAVESGAIGTGYQHYRAFGWSEGRDPSTWLDASAYLAANPDVAAAGVDPLAHFLMFGQAEGRILSAIDLNPLA